MPFSEKGFDEANLRGITDHAGANIAQICRYFDSNEGLFRHAIIPTLFSANFHNFVTAISLYCLRLDSQKSIAGASPPDHDGRSFECND